jgi:hypothetical protein
MSPKLASLAPPEGISGRLGAALRWPERLDAQRPPLTSTIAPVV